MTRQSTPLLPQASLSQLEEAIKSLGLPMSRGIEKEGLRADTSGFIAQTDHPEALGHPLTHEHITTDYSEALLELITGVHASRESLLNELKQVHEFVQANLKDEVLWAGSMPCQLDGDESIRIAEYGDSNIGQLKYVYRQGLGVRYGRIMQSIAGLHFNFSLSDDFWQIRQKAVGSDKSLKDFKSEQYFGLIRNFRRYSWLLMYLFGSSPALDQSFLKQADHDLEPLDDEGSYYKPYATSLRMGDLGYHNNAQSSLSICFNTLGNFTTTLGRAIRTSYEPYEKIGVKQGENFVQLNTNILQIENEYYSSIRPKRSANSGERPTDALIERGVEYVEVRCLDLNPFLPLGISDKQIDFMDLFLMYCLLIDSPYISDEECSEIDTNFSRTVNEGRAPNLNLSQDGNPISLHDWGGQLCQAMKPIAELLDIACEDKRYSTALEEQLNKVRQPDLTPSAEILAVMKQENLSWLAFSKQLSEKHQLVLRADQVSNTNLKKEADQSFEKANTIKASDSQEFAEFLAAYNA